MECLQEKRIKTDCTVRMQIAVEIEEGKGSYNWAGVNIGDDHQGKKTSNKNFTDNLYVKSWSRGLSGADREELEIFNCHSAVGDLSIKQTHRSKSRVFKKATVLNSQQKKASLLFLVSAKKPSTLWVRTSCRSHLDLFSQATWSKTNENTNTNTYEWTNKKANTDTNANVWKRLWVAPIAGLVWIYLPQPRDLPSCPADTARAISDFESQFTPQPFPFNEPQKQVNRAALTSDWNDWTQSVWVFEWGI